MVGLVLLLLVLLSACSRKQDPAPLRAPVASTAPKPPPAPPEPPKPVLCPLTGQQAPAGVDINRPALAVKIDNHPKARPQAGLEAADIVYEELVEGGLTRFLAVFNCGTAPRLGPIRSARLVDPDLLVQYSPVLFGYSGAAPPVLAKVQSTAGLVNLVHGSNGPAYFRQKGRPAPHNLFTSSDALRATRSAQGVPGPPRTGLTFGPAPAAPAPGNSVSFTYSAGDKIGYVFDAAGQRYLRSINGAPHRSEGGGQLSVVNVVIMKVPVQLAGGSPSIGVTGEGELTVLRNGQSFAGRWRRTALSDQTVLVDANGQPINLEPGSTWIHLVPAGQPVTVQ